LPIRQAVIDDPIPAEIPPEKRCAIGREIEGLEAGPGAGQAGDLIGFAAAEYQLSEPLPD
jgi:hypothetical protein